MPTAIAKLSPPRLQRDMVERERLYRLLDKGAEASGCIWIGAGAGCGKTVLAAAWARARARRLYWFTADEGDASAGNFLHFLAQLPGGRHEPPRYVPDGRVTLAVGVRGFVRAFYRCLPEGALLVLDEAEKLPAGSEGAQVLSALVQEAPGSVQLLVLSRIPPDASLARAQVTGRVTLLGWAELRLTLQETHVLAAARNPAIDDVVAGRIHARSDGWAAGARLLVEAPMQIEHAATALNPEALFGYIASELFDALPAETRQVLLAIACLPSVSAEVAAALSSNPRAGAVLEQWSRRNFFLAHVPGVAGTHYRLHPLLREFLLVRAGEQLPQDHRQAGLRLAAASLAATGDVQGAAGLWIELENWPQLAGLLEEAGDRLLEQGRQGEVLRWLDALPAGVEEQDAQLGLWRARALLATVPARGLELLAGLWPRLEQAGSPRRLADAWEAVVCGHLFLRRPQRMAQWHQVAVRLVDRLSGPGDAPLRRRVLAATFVGFSKTDPRPWSEGEQAAIDMAANPATPPDVRLTFGASVHFHYQWHIGAKPLPQACVADLRELCRNGRGSVHQRLVWLWIDVMLLIWFDPDESLRQVKELVRMGTAMAEEHGIQEFGFTRFVPMIVAAQHGHPEAAAAHAAALRAMPAPPAHALFELPPRMVQLAMYHLHLADTAAAGAYAQQALSAAREAGSPPQRMVAQCAAARVAAAKGDLAAAYGLLRQACAIARAHQVGAFRCAPWLAAAIAALQARRRGAAIGFTRRALREMAAYGTLRAPQGSLTCRQEFEQLCALAWAHDVERPWVASLVRMRGLRAPPGCAYDGWPWPLRIRTFGGLELERDGQPVVFGRKAPRKVLELLQFMLSAGPRPVAATQAVDALWPDEEGDAGHRAFLTALHRLRKLVGEASVVHQEGRIGLDRHFVHVDRYAFEQMLEGQPHDGALRAAMTLYCGDFLADHEAPWAELPRTRLRARFQQAQLRANRLPIGDAA